MVLPNSPLSQTRESPASQRGRMYSSDLGVLVQLKIYFKLDIGLTANTVYIEEVFGLFYALGGFIGRQSARVNRTRTVQDVGLYDIQNRFHTDLFKILDIY